MLQQATRFCVQGEIQAAIGAGGVVTEGNVWYYDGTRVYRQIAAYTGDSSWYTCAGYTRDAYKAWVLAVTAGANWPVGALNGWRIFPHGLLGEYQRTGDTDSRDAVLKLAYNSAFADSGGRAECDYSRETAYMIHAFLAAERLGQARNPLLADSANYALGHIDQWFISRTCAGSSLQPFMVGLTLEALIAYFEATGDTRVLPRLRIAADELWNSNWVPANHAFDSPDLNLLIAPAYAWLWQRSSASRFLDRGDEIFSNGVLYANFFSGKQFSQNYRWSFDYVSARNSTPRKLTVTSTGFLYSRATGTYNGKLSLTNTGNVSIAGPLVVELMNLTSGVTLANATGTNGPVPYLSVANPGTLPPGQALSVNVQFRNPLNALISFLAAAY